jgi:hypothetical protein
LAAASGSHPRNRTGVIRQKSYNVAGSERWKVFKKFESKPKVNNDGNEFQGVDMEAFLEKVCWLAGSVDGFHGESELK